MKKIFNLDFFFSTMIVVGVLTLLSLLPDISKPFNTLSEALADIDITDVFYSKLDISKKADTNIVIINAAYSNRAETANLFKKILANKPKVIAVDFYYKKAKSQKEDSLLSEVISSSENIIMASYFYDTTTNQPSLPDNPHALFKSITKFRTKNNLYGYVNFQSDLSFRTIRTFKPKVKFKDSTYLSFATMAAGIYDSNALKRLLLRDKDEETISFKGNINKFMILESSDIAKDSSILEIVKNKIVFYGFLGNNITDSFNVEDKFFTPLNNKYIGRTLPDMYGITIHANIAASILEGEFIHTAPDSIIMVIVFLIIYLNIAFFEFIKDRVPWLYGGEMKIFVLVEVVIVLYIVVWLFAQFLIKINVSTLLIALLIAPDTSEIYSSSIKNYLLLFIKRFKKMKTLKILVLAVVFMALPSALISQTVFKVFILKGGASLLRADDSKVVNLKVGDNLSKKDKLMLKGDVYLVINHENGSSVEIKKAGNYKVADLEAKVKNKNDALLKKYSGYIAESIKKSNESEGYTGGLERGLFAKDFTFLMPKTTKMLMKDNAFNWNRVEGAKTYLFMIIDENGNPKFEKETKETFIKTDISKISLSTNKCSYWQVLVNGDKSRTSERHCIFVEPADKDKQIKDELKQLTSALNKKLTAPDYLLLASFYEQYGLLSDAYECYKKSVDSAKGIHEYQQALSSFIGRASKFSINK